MKARKVVLSLISPNKDEIGYVIRASLAPASEQTMYGLQGNLYIILINKYIYHL